MSPPASIDVRPELRRLLWLVSLGYLVFVVYGSLVPLNFHPLPLDEAWRRFGQTRWLSLGIASRADWVANLLLFVPLAFLGRALVAVDGRGPSALVDLLLWVTCAGLALGIEFTQVFFPGRTVSLNDPAAEGIGALVGLLMHRWFGSRLLALLNMWWLPAGGLSLATALLRVYLLCLAVFAAMPLDLTISPVEVFHKYAQGRVHLVPFSDLRAGLADVVYEIGTDVGLWLPVGLLWRIQGRSRASILGRGLAVALALELLQVFVYSRVTSSTDVLTAGAGCWLGSWLPGLNGAATQAATAPGQPAARAGAMRHLPAALFLLWAAGVLILFWFPFDVRTEGAWLRPRLEGFWRVPFSTYYQGTEFHALNELLRKVLAFAPGGAFWALVMRQRDAVSRSSGALLGWIGVLALTTCAFLVEAGQLFLVDKVADPTDAVLCALGGSSALAIVLRLRRGAPEGGAGGASAPQAPRAGRWLHWAHRSAVVGLAATCVMAAVRILDTTPDPLPLAAWPIGWALATLALLLAPGRTWVGVAVLAAILLSTPRYGPEMGLLLSMQLLPMLALLASSAIWLARRSQRSAPGFEPLFDGVFALFFVWVLVLAVRDAGSSATLVDPLYHPLNYGLCALMYWMARRDAGSSTDRRRLAMTVLAAIGLAVSVQVQRGHFHLSGHDGFLLALGLPLAYGLAVSAPSPGRRVAWWACLAALAAMVVAGQNRSAFLALLAFALALVPWRRPLGWSVLALALLSGLLTALWSTGLLDRFFSVIDIELAQRVDEQARQTVDARLALWRVSWELFLAHPLTGVGPGRFEQALAAQAPWLDRVPAHNTWLTLLSETGLPGLLLAASGFVTVLLSVKAPTQTQAASFDAQRVAKLGLVVWLVYGLFNSRADFPWAYFLAGWAIPVRWHAVPRSGEPAAVRGG